MSCEGCDMLSFCLGGQVGVYFVCACVCLRCGGDGWKMG